MNAQENTPEKEQEVNSDPSTQISNDQESTDGSVIQDIQKDQDDAAATPATTEGNEVVDQQTPATTESDEVIDQQEQVATASLDKTTGAQDIGLRKEALRSANRAKIQSACDAVVVARSIVGQEGCNAGDMVSTKEGQTIFLQGGVNSKILMDMGDPNDKFTITDVVQGVEPSWTNDFKVRFPGINKKTNKEADILIHICK